MPNLPIFLSISGIFCQDYQVEVYRSGIQEYQVFQVIQVFNNNMVNYLEFKKNYKILKKRVFSKKEKNIQKKFCKFFRPTIDFCKNHILYPKIIIMHVQI